MRLSLALSVFGLSLALGEQGQGMVAISAADGTPEAAQSVTEQDRLDTIVRAFNRLPQPELERLGVDIQSERIVDGTMKAEAVRRAWRERQQELKRAMESMTKPAEHMAEMARRIKQFQGQVVGSARLAGVEASSEEFTAEQIGHVLRELESTLTDIDNARDFHTIGGWPVLVDMLDSRYPSDLRALAALAVGTAVKNSYDYQLWVLEKLPGVKEEDGRSSSSSSYTALKLLLSLLDPPTDQELQRKSLYAISSALRGNADVQEAILDLSNDDGSGNFVGYLQTLAASNATSPEISRKVWSLVSDMLQETAFVRGELMTTLATLPAGSAQLQQAHQQVQALRMLGDVLCSQGWAALASQTLRRIGATPGFVSVAALRATLVATLKAAGEMLDLCPERLQLHQQHSQVAGGADVASVLSGQARQLHDRFIVDAAHPSRDEQQNSNSEEDISVAAAAAAAAGNDGVDFDMHNELDEKLVMTFADEVVYSAGRILQRHSSAAGYVSSERD